MKKKRRLFIRTGILLVLICALGYTIYNAVFAGKESISEGSDAPNFVLEDTNGKRIELSDLKGKGVFLNFWGTWCEPCKKEFPYMANQYKHFKDQGVEIVAVNVGESKIAVHNFMKSYGVNFPVVLDTDRKCLMLYVSPLPTILFNHRRKVVKVVTGTMTESMIHDYMNLIKPGETSG